MMQKLTTSSLAVALLLSPMLMAAEQSADDARIPFADLGGIQDWRAADDDTLYIQGRSDQWYRAELMGPCIGLDFANTIGFVVEPVGTFTEFSSIVVEGRECHLDSLVEIAGPPNELAASAESDSEDEDRQAAETDGRVVASSAESSDGGEADGGGGEAYGGGGEEDGGGSASISFADLGGIQDWRAVDDDTLYVQGRSDQWYRAELLGTCPGLDFETTIGFVLEPLGSFDRFSSVLVDGRECPLKSLVESAPPPA